MPSPPPCPLQPATDPHYLRSLAAALPLGRPVLLEGLGEGVDASLAPVLLKQTFKSVSSGGGGCAVQVAVRVRVVWWGLAGWVGWAVQQAGGTGARPVVPLVRSPFTLAPTLLPPLPPLPILSPAPPPLLRYPALPLCPRPPPPGPSAPQSGMLCIKLGDQVVEWGPGFRCG